MPANSPSTVTPSGRVSASRAGVSETWSVPGAGGTGGSDALPGGAVVVVVVVVGGVVVVVRGRRRGRWRASLLSVGASWWLSWWSSTGRVGDRDSQRPCRHSGGTDHRDDERVGARRCLRLVCRRSSTAPDVDVDVTPVGQRPGDQHAGCRRCCCRHRRRCLAGRRGSWCYRWSTRRRAEPCRSWSQVSATR